MRLNICVNFIICCLGVRVSDLSALPTNNVSKRNGSTIDNRTMVKADTSIQKRFSISSKSQSQESNNFDSRKHIDWSLDNISKRSQLVDSPELEEIILGKRQDCALPKNMRQDVSVLYRKLNDTFFLGRNQGPSEHKTGPVFQLTHCVEEDELRSWDKLNSRTICPWLISELDVGVDTYPRYFEQATCLCRRCIGGVYSYCKYGFQMIEYFKFGGCLNGFAVLNRMTLNIRTHCYCDRPEPGLYTPVPNYTSEK